MLNGLTIQLFNFSFYGKLRYHGFGRIGRNVLRAMTQKQVERFAQSMNLTDTRTLAHLLKWDSVHGKFDGEIGYDDENIIVRGHKIKNFKGARSGEIWPWKNWMLMLCSNRPVFSTSREQSRAALE